MRLRSAVLGTIAVVMLLSSFAATASAIQTYTVTKTADTNDGTCDADCSLREAVVAANAYLPLVAEVEIVVPSGTYQLTISGSGEDKAATGDLDITRYVAIRGAGARVTRVVGDGADRVLDVLPGYSGLQLDGVAVSGGGGVSQGGGIRAESSLSVENSAVVDNETSIATGATRQGGGVYVGPKATSARFADDLIANNAAIASAGDPGPPRGGGLYDATAPYWNGFVVINTTVSGNIVDGRLSDGGGSAGAGLYVNPVAGEDAPLLYATVAGNHAFATNASDVQGPGVFASDRTSAQLSIVAYNTANGTSGGEQCTQALDDESSTNLFTSGSGCDSALAHDVIADPLLGPLSDNGGQSDTMEPQQGSPAIDIEGEFPCIASPNETDQRGTGFTRAGHGLSCDAGAVEVQNPIPPGPPLTGETPERPHTASHAPVVLGTRTVSQPRTNKIKSIPAARAFGLPSTKQCVSRRRFTVHIRKLPGVTWVRAVLNINHKRVRTVKRRQISAIIDLRGLPKGTFVLSISATATDGRKAAGTRTYHTCVPKRKRHYGPGSL